MHYTETEAFSSYKFADFSKPYIVWKHSSLIGQKRPFLEMVSKYYLLKNLTR
jgi:hypothetical protein